MTNSKKSSDDTEHTEQLAPENESERKPAADLEKIADWFIETVRLEQERSESRPKLFERGEGIELVLGD
jgi:hypothetical protein